MRLGAVMVEKWCREPYVIKTPEQMARVGKYAAENHTTNAIHHFSKYVPNLTL